MDVAIEAVRSILEEGEVEIAVALEERKVEAAEAVEERKLEAAQALEEGEVSAAETRQVEAAAAEEGELSVQEEYEQSRTVTEIKEKICTAEQRWYSVEELKHEDDGDLDIANGTVEESEHKNLHAAKGEELEETKRDDEITFVEQNDFEEDMSIDSSDDQNFRAEILNNGALNEQQASEDTKPTLKRKRLSQVDHGPSVEVTYRQLTRESRTKLQEVLLQWAEWHEAQDFGDDVLEDGKEIYFPALQVGPASTSKMHFWMDKPLKRACDMQDLEDRQIEVPLYDRGCTTVLLSQDAVVRTEGHLELREEAARCFNCGSYSHALRDCPRPRDFAAISSARKMHSLKKGPVTPSHRYYQSSAGGKFDDIKPGVLGSETRQSLGIKDNDPPPWLNRMREIGYPPGYLAPEEDEPSGIVIFGEDDGLASAEDGEIVEIEPPAIQSTKMTVEFPGINAPIPENADKRRWSSPDGSSRIINLSRHHESFSDNRSRESDYRSSRTSSRGNETAALHRSLSDNGRRGTSRTLHPDDYLRPPGESSPRHEGHSYYSSRHSTSLSSRISSREQSNAWAQAQAALESVRSRASTSRSSRQ